MVRLVLIGKGVAIHAVQEGQSTTVCGKSLETAKDYSASRASCRKCRPVSGIAR